MGANVLAFVALLAVLVVVIYVMNKGKEKEATMFSGPAPASPPAREMARAQASAADETVRSEESPPIGGTVQLADGVDAPSGGTLFIYARRAGQEGGPPLAVQRVQQPQFPLSFQVGASQVMIPGMRWEGPVDISARWDSDGDALSRSPEDLEAAPQSGVELGAMDLTLKLR